MLDDPVEFFGNEGLDDRGGNIGVVIRAQRVANVVEQRHDDIFLCAAIAVRARRGLQAVRQPVDRKAGIIVL